MSEKYERVILQNCAEFDDFIRLLKSENVKSYLEIGCKHGGSIWRAAKAFSKDTKIVAVDLPHGDLSFKQTLPNLKHCCERLNREGHNVTMIIGDSTDPKIIEQVKALAPFDACFIDANHTLPYIQKDWENYGPLCRIVAFHDISFWRAQGQEPKDFKKLQVEVPIFWNEIKDKYRHKEFRREKTDNGIGVLWP